MKVRAQIGMVLNLDKCLGCHTCAVSCKNVWTSRAGLEYAWFNNVETRPGTGYPTNWEDQGRWKGGWRRDKAGRLRLAMGNRARLLSKLFANPNLPGLDDYYDPFTFDYGHLQQAPLSKAPPVGRPHSLVTGGAMAVKSGPNWEDMLGGPFSQRSNDHNFEGVQKKIYGQFEETFMAYLPRLCEHCLNPACVAACPAGAGYKRVEDGIVLIDQDKCRGWRLCVSACPYKKVYFNWKSGKSEKCLFCYPRLEGGVPTLCAETCVGRIRYLGVMLYDADRIGEAAVVADPKRLHQAQLDMFLNPHDPAVQAAALQAGIPAEWVEAACRSPIYKMAVDWQIAFPLHPEYRTLPMVWYVPPLSPISKAAEAGDLPMAGVLPDLDALRIPMRYLANLLTAGDVAPVRAALGKMLAMRHFMRARTQNPQELGSAGPEAHPDDAASKRAIHVLAEAGLTASTALAMYDCLAIARYEDRFVVPTTHREYAGRAFHMKGASGFAFNCGPGGLESGGGSGLFGKPRQSGPNTPRGGRAL
ncbi:nitrate reductase subunit beta [Formicincola oecophyllae]|uniref:Nitrate reductase subunit beta n=1 Tax=Formicincola oecophyllae TaxID=2558361 RepID=A0A4Y6U9B5_9PROT|nr:nitrate reductase subunit beta [Formicincola oecophyllae]QDH13046.1 nitrate reductase subunit beta [Formicincola oecophyllae]